MKEVMLGSEDPFCRWCEAPLEKMTAMSVHSKRRLVFTACPKCDKPGSILPSEATERKKITEK